MPKCLEIGTCYLWHFVNIGSYDGMSQNLLILPEDELFNSYVWYKSFFTAPVKVTVIF